MIPTVDVVVPVHDQWELTESCLEHLRRQTLPHSVIVCDNGSTDGTPERLRAQFPAVHVIEVGANVGFAAACNRGVRRGRGEIVVLLNNDVDCRPDFLERLIAPFVGNERLGSVAGLLLEPSERRVDCFGLAVDPTLAGFPRQRGSRATGVHARQLTLVGPSGAAGAYRRQAWEHVGGLDEGVFFYGEDVDIALQLHASGWSTYGASDAVAVHVGSASAVPRSAWQRYQSGFSRGYFLRRYGTLRGGLGPRAVVIEAIVVLADAVLFSRDLAALRGRVAGWRAAKGLPRKQRPPQEALEYRLTFVESLRLRLAVFTGSPVHRGRRLLPIHSQPRR